MTEERSNEFKARLQRLRNEYPEVFLPAWMPEDFERVYGHPISDKEAERVVDTLARWCDPTTGVTSETVYGAVRVVVRSRPQSA